MSLNQIQAAYSPKAICHCTWWPAHGQPDRKCSVIAISLCIPQLSFSVGLGSSWEQYGTTAFRTTVTTVTPESSGSWTPQTLRTLLRVFAHCICSRQGAAPLAAPFHHPSCQALPPTKNRCSSPDDRYHVPLQPRATKTWAQNTANGDKQRKRCKLLGKNTGARTEFRRFRLRWTGYNLVQACSSTQDFSLNVSESWNRSMISDIGKEHMHKCTHTHTHQSSPPRTWKADESGVVPTKCYKCMQLLSNAVYRRKFRSQTSDNMDRWKAEMGKRQREEKSRREKMIEEKESEERRRRCAKR